MGAAFPAVAEQSEGNGQALVKAVVEKGPLGRRCCPGKALTKTGKYCIDKIRQGDVDGIYHSDFQDVCCTHSHEYHSGRGVYQPT